MKKELKIHKNGTGVFVTHSFKIDEESNGTFIDIDLACSEELFTDDVLVPVDKMDGVSPENMIIVVKRNPDGTFRVRNPNRGVVNTTEIEEGTRFTMISSFRENK